MLELARFPSCVRRCHTLFEDTLRQRMSERKYTGSTRDASRSEHKDKSTHGPREHRHGRNSANDPSISSTHSNKHVSSNLRSHPRAELRGTYAPRQNVRPKHDFPGVNHVSVNSNGGRKRSCEDDEEEDVWVEHTSSSGRVYFYNKRNGVSQWEKPKSLAKRPKTEDYSMPKPQSSSTSSTSHSHPHTSSAHSHTHTLGSKEPTHWSYSTHHTSHPSHHTPHPSHHTPHSSHYNTSRERERPHSSHCHSNRASRSSSKSTSASPTPTPRGRGHYEKTTPTRHSRTLNKRSSSPKALPSSSTLSPGPSSSSSSLTPHSISQSLAATQHYIDQTSAIIKHQQKLFSGTGDVATSVQSSPSIKHTPHTSHTSHVGQPLQSARQRLSYSALPSNGPLLQDPVGASTPLTPLHNSASGLASPQLAGMENLHPLQRALLLQQQQQQQHQVQSIQDSFTNSQHTPQPSSCLLPSTPSHPPLPPPTATPPLSALPSHLLPQPSHLPSPYSSPSSLMTSPQMHSLPHPIPGPYTPQALSSQSVAIFPYVMTPSSTPISGIYMADASASCARGFVAAASPPVRVPMSRLGRREAGGDLSKFPDPSTVEAPAPSTASTELFDRSLAEKCWGPALDGMQRQLDSSSREVLSHRNKEALYFQGRIKRSQLSLDTSRVRSTTRRERLLALEQLLGEIDQR